MTSACRRNQTSGGSKQKQQAYEGSSGGGKDSQKATPVGPAGTDESRTAPRSAPKVPSFTV
jgi:hypothetical protein